MVSQSLFHVDGPFARLTTSLFPEGLPAALTDVSYTLDVSACDEWKVASGPSAGGPLADLAGLSPGG